MPTLDRTWTVGSKPSMNLQTTCTKSARRASKGTTEESCDARRSRSKVSVWLKAELGPRSGGGSSTWTNRTVYPLPVFSSPSLKHLEGSWQKCKSNTTACLIITTSQFINRWFWSMPLRVTRILLAHPRVTITTFYVKGQEFEKSWCSLEL